MGSNNSSDRYAKEQRQVENARQRRIDKGTKDLKTMFDDQFNRDFYSRQQDAYMDFYKPQMEDQYAKQQEQLLYALSRTGNTQSSVRGEKFADLQQQMDMNRQQLLGNATGATNKKRGQVFDSYQSALSQLQASADPAAAAASAANMSGILNAPQQWEPLGQIFTDVTAGMATQADLERRGKARYNTGWFNKV